MPIHTKSRRFAIKRQHCGKPEPRWQLVWSGHVIVDAHSSDEIRAELTHLRGERAFR